MVRRPVLNGDVPLIRGEDLKAVTVPLDDLAAPAALAIATCVVTDPTGYGRVLRKDGRVVEICEHRDLRNEGERAIREINAGIYAANVVLLKRGRLDPRARQRAGRALSHGHRRVREQRQRANRYGDARRRSPRRGQRPRPARPGRGRDASRASCASVALAGATVRDGARLDAGVTLEPDVVVEAGAALRGSTHVRRGAIGRRRLRAHQCRRRRASGRQAVLGRDGLAHRAGRAGRAVRSPAGRRATSARTRTSATSSRRRRRGWHGAPRPTISRTWATAIIGEGANIGAGTIFCNYDGAGSTRPRSRPVCSSGATRRSSLRSPSDADAYVATGTTVTRDVPAEALAIGRAPQQNKEGYAPRLRARFKAARDTKDK